MNKNPYKISYGAPLTVKDQPHREFDTARNSSQASDAMAGDQVFLVSELELSEGIEILEPKIEELECVQH